jgi:class 3 adenylate cyclase
MPALPSGTVTFVFTDIEDSTTLLKRLGERYREVLAGHRRIVRTTFEAANGIEIDSQGDAFFFAFPRARDAVGAAVDVQRAHAASEWPEDAAVRVRIGLHTGEPVVDDEGYLGLDVVRAARICTAAQGGRVLLSESTRALLGSALPDDVSVFPLGERQLKSIDEPERIYELAIDGVDAAETADAEEAGLPAERAPEDGEQIERRFEDVGARYARRIQDGVFQSLERTLGLGRTAPGRDERTRSSGEDEDADVEGLAARASALEEQIATRVQEALRAKGIPPDRPV